jgi:hypothetical protein
MVRSRGGAWAWVAAAGGGEGLAAEVLPLGRGRREPVGGAVIPRAQWLPLPATHGSFCTIVVLPLLSFAHHTRVQWLPLPLPLLLCKSKGVAMAMSATERWFELICTVAVLPLLSFTHRAVFFFVAVLCRKTWTVGGENDSEAEAEAESFGLPHIPASYSGGIQIWVASEAYYQAWRLIYPHMSFFDAFGIIARSCAP